AQWLWTRSVAPVNRPDVRASLRATCDLRRSERSIERAARAISFDPRDEDEREPADAVRRARPPGNLRSELRILLGGNEHARVPAQQPLELTLARRLDEGSPGVEHERAQLLAIVESEGDERHTVVRGPTERRAEQ